MVVPCEKKKKKKSKEPAAPSVIQEEMAAPQHVRAPLARALRATATASAPAPIKSQGISRRALLALSEPQLRQLALDLGQVPHPCTAPGTGGFVCFGYLNYLPTCALPIFDSACAA